MTTEDWQVVRFTVWANNFVRLAFGVAIWLTVLTGCSKADPKIDREARYVGDILQVVSVKTRVDTNLCKSQNTGALYSYISDDPSISNILNKVPRWQQSKRFVDPYGNDYRIVFVTDKPPDAMLFIVLTSSNSPPLYHVRTNILWIHE